jgi:RNA polymerase sigma factor (sigma-70 family)
VSFSARDRAGETFMSQICSARRCIDVETMSMSDRWVDAEFETIFREHYSRIVRVVRRVLQRDSEAEEVCADVFLRLYRKGPGVAAGGKVGGWLYRTATRASIDVLRASQRRGIEEQLEENDSVSVDEDAENPLVDLLRQEHIAEIRSVLAKLKLEKAQLLLLRHSGLSYREIADAMKLSFNSVGTKFARAEAEFSALYERQQRQSLKRQPLQTAKEGQ